MKVYYIFEIKSEFIKLYLDNSAVLFNILKNIYYLEKEEVSFGYSLFKQITNKINKNLVDREIFLRCHKDIPYSKRNNTHYINNLYRDEVSRLVVKKSYIKLELEQKKSSFFDILMSCSNNYFACDFKNCDFFFLNGSLYKEAVYCPYNKSLV